MKNRIPLILWLLFIGILPLQVSATHIVGGELTYSCQGDDPNIPGNKLYLFNMKVYRDCVNGQAPFDSAPGAQTGVLTVYKSDNLNQNNPFASIELDPPVIDTIDPSENNPCVEIPPNVCLERGEYFFTYSLPEDAVNSYYIIYQRCCRNNSINNINNPNQAGATYYVEITVEAQAECNNSPVFIQFPPPVVCADFPLNYDHSAFDQEGDQLIYSFCAPLLGGSQNNPNPTPDLPPPYNPVSFVVPNFDELNPMGGNPQISIDPQTGIITGTPLVQGQYVVGICVEEYRNGVLMSTIQRDFQFNVSYCEPTVNANIQGVDAGDAFQIFSCEDSTVTIINESTNEDFIEEYEWQFNVDPGSGIPLSFDTRDVTVTFPGPGFYEGVMILNPGTQCSDTAFVEVTVTSPMFPDFVGVYDTCVAGPVEFQDLTDVNGAALDTWGWEFGDLNASDEQNPVYEYDDPGIFNVVLTVTDTLGCAYSRSKELTWLPAPEAIIFQPSESVGCPPLDVTFTNLSYPIDTTYSINWSFGDDSTSTAFSPDHTYLIPGNFSIHVTVTSPIGCFEEAFFPKWIDVDSLPIADFTYEPPSYISNFNPTVEFNDKSKRAAFWAWEFGRDGEYGSTLGPNPSFTFPDTGFVEVELAIMHYYGCEDTIVKMVEVEPKITYNLPNAFTPNNDGLNDEFRGGGYFRGIQDFEMTIWDRYGGVVYQSFDPREGWNGRKNNQGRMSPNGVYVCVVRYTGPRGVKHEEKGFASLIR